MDRDYATFASTASTEQSASETEAWFAMHCSQTPLHASSEELQHEMLHNETEPVDHETDHLIEPIPELELYHCLRNNEFILGTFLPIVVLITLVTNCLVSAVLLQRHMLTPVNILLLGISMFNMVTGTSPVPVLLHFYSFRNYRDYVSYSWCFWYQFLIDFVPTVCHTTSIWLTVFVALQRYIYVCRPHSASNWCTVRVSTMSIFITLLLATLYYLPVLFEKSCIPVETVSLRQSNTTVIALATVGRDWFISSFKMYIETKCWSRFLLVHFIPSGSLIVFTVLLIREIRKANQRRRTLVSRDSQSSRSSDSTSTTLMLLAIVILFLLVEIPPGLAFLLFLPTVLYSDGFSTVVMSVNDYMVVSLILNIGVLFSYPINFFIYCAMSRQFRQTFYSLFGATCGYVAPDDRTERSRRFSSSSKVVRRSRTVIEGASRTNGNLARRHTDAECITMYSTKENKNLLPYVPDDVNDYA